MSIAEQIAKHDAKQSREPNAHNTQVGNWPPLDSAVADKAQQAIDGARAGTSSVPDTKPSKPTEDKPRAGGRKDSQGQEAVPDPAVLKASAKELLRLAEAVRQAKHTLGAKVKVVAEKSGFMARNVRALLQQAIDRDEILASRRDQEQLALVSSIADELAPKPKSRDHRRAGVVTHHNATHRKERT